MSTLDWPCKKVSSQNTSQTMLLLLLANKNGVKMEANGCKEEANDMQGKI